MRFRHFTVWLAAAVATALVAPAARSQDRVLEPYTVAVLNALDKVSARVSVLEAPVGGEAKFGALTVKARACQKAPPTETPESAAYLEIEEKRPNQPAPARVFAGWMFASSPAVSAMDHAVYDIWVVDCKNPASTESSSPQ
jgi:hypothetical protein